ncbi:MAG: prepilin-type N-terminal cleavage/methylation domain-containing protein [bacterium]|nr:prepilin-type N-terminal cleavage/methylation domain-containing protein [bacterium]
MKKGFTLIELMVVISIIAILSSVGLATYTSYGKKAKDSRRMVDLEVIRQALELYRSDNGVYPPVPTVSGFCTQISNTAYTQVKNALESGYLDKVPQDPQYADTYQDYFYISPINGQKYALYAELEQSDSADDGITGCDRIDGLPNEYDYRVTNP